MQEFLRYGANPNCADYDSRSPLHIAVSEGFAIHSPLLLLKI